MEYFWRKFLALTLSIEHKSIVTLTLVAEFIFICDGCKEYKA